MKMTAANVATWVGGRLENGREDAPVEAVSIDSRTMTEGDLFFAIVGPRHDGHRFIAQALRRGAVGVVVASSVPITGAAVCIRVADTARALQDLAGAVRRQWGAQVVAITGSMGKTTTKEAAAAALAARYRVLKSEKNLNNLYGLPLSILRHRDEDMAVLELGMSAPGEIARLTEIAEPDVGVLTNVAEVHREFFDSVETIAQAKGELFEGLPAGSVAVVNADDPLALAQARRFSGRCLSFGLDERAEVRGSSVVRTGEGMRFTARYEGEQVEVRAPLYGRHNVYNLLAALTAAAAIGVPLAAAAERLSELAPAPHRGERIRFKEGFLVIDETYNSNPTALVYVLEMLEQEEARRRLAVLGDMLELGERAEELHLDAGRQVASLKIDRLIGVGALGCKIVEGARRAGMRSSALLTAEDAEEAAGRVAESVAPGDVVLLKASRGLGLDRTVERLRERFEVESV